MILIKREDGGVTVRTVFKQDTLENEKKRFEERTGIKVLEITEIDESQLPPRNYRDAWTHDLDIDLEKAKECQKRLIAQKAHERISTDEFGFQDLSKVREEMAELDFNVSTLDELYNLWPKSIGLRTEPRKYRRN